MKGKILILLLFLLILPASVFADGMPIPRNEYKGSVHMPEQKAVISWDGQNETMVISTKIQSDDLTDIAWVVPIPSKIKPEVEEGDIQLFYDLADLFRQEREGTNLRMSLQEAGAGAEVEVIEVKTVGIYNIVILKATDSGALVEWLNTHDFKVSEDLESFLEDYVKEENMYFVANKLNLGAQHARAPTEDELACANKIYETYHSDPHIRHSILYYSSEFDFDVFSTWMTKDYFNETCRNASPDITYSIFELKNGVATPLKFTFQPETPFYPMKISGLGKGGTEAILYFLSNGNGLESGHFNRIDQVKKVPSVMREKYNLSKEVKYANEFTFTGSLNSLEEDSYFTVDSVPLSFHVKNFFNKIKLAIFSLFHPLILLVGLAAVLSITILGGALYFRSHAVREHLFIASLVIAIPLMYLVGTIVFMANMSWYRLRPLVLLIPPLIVILSSIYIIYHNLKKTQRS